MGWPRIAFGKRLSQLEKDAETFNKNKDYWTKRPYTDQLLVRDEYGAALRMYPFEPVMLYDMALNIDAIRTIVQRIKEEMFRPGLKVVEKFAFKCNNCKKEFMSQPLNEKRVLQCDTCKSTNLSRPDPANGTKLKYLLKTKVNQNKQTFKDVAKEVEWDLDVFDNGCWLFLKTYEFDLDGNITKRKIKEIIRGDPLQIYLIIDNSGRLGYRNQEGTTLEGAQSAIALVCPRPEHRDVMLTGERCATCGCKGVKAIAEVRTIYGQATNVESKKFFYIEGEIIYRPKYYDSMIYGYSNIYTIWMKMMTLFYQDRYMMTYFDKMRTPRGIWVVPVRSIRSFMEAWEAIKKWSEDDPHNIHPLAVETDRTGKTVTQFIDLMRSLEEMQFIEARNEYRRTAASLYGLMPMIVGEESKGWGNNGLELTISNRTIISHQHVMEERFFDPITEEFLGVDDWVIRFESPESMDKLRDAQILGQDLANMNTLRANKFRVRFDHNNNLLWDKTPADYDQPEPMTDEQSDKRPTAPIEQQTNFEGEPLQNRPSDIGGGGSGFPASGENTSISNKSEGIVDEISKSLMSEFDIEQINKSINTMRDEARRQVWQYGYVDVAGEQRQYVRDIVQLSFTKNLPKSVAVQNLLQAGVSKQQAELIVKTEYQHALNRAKELAYRELDPDGTKFKYYWDTSADHEVCPACQEVADLTKDGVSLDQLKKVVSKVAKKYKKSVIRKYHLHPADRCVMKRKMK